MKYKIIQINGNYFETTVVDQGSTFRLMIDWEIIFSKLIKDGFISTPRRMLMSEKNLY